MTLPALDSEFTAGLGLSNRDRLQDKTIRTARYRDDVGRLWTCGISIMTMHPCTPITPAGWASDVPHPWLVPDQKYLRVSDIGSELTVDYDAWLRDVQRARRDYDGWLMECAVKMYNAGAMAAIERRDVNLLKLAGVAPMDPVFIKAMKARLPDGRPASRWVHGLRHPITGEKYPTPPWALEALSTLTIVETWGESDTDLSTGDVWQFVDVEGEDAEAAQRIADRIADAERYGDFEDDADPDASPDFEPLPRRRGRSPKTR